MGEQSIASTRRLQRLQQHLRIHEPQEQTSSPLSREDCASHRTLPHFDEASASGLVCLLCTPDAHSKMLAVQQSDWGQAQIKILSWRPGSDACSTGLQGALAQYLTAEQELKEEVYALFKQHPELLYPVEEGLTKGGQLLSRRQWQSPNRCLCRAAAAAPAEQHSTAYVLTSALHTACPC